MTLNIDLYIGIAGMFLLLLAFLLIGCIETVTLIHVKKDGSGTLEEIVVFSKSFMELMASFSGQEDSAEEPVLWTEEELAEYT